MGEQFASFCMAKDAKVIVLDKRPPSNPLNRVDYLEVDAGDKDGLEPVLRGILERTQDSLHLVNFSGRVANSPILSMSREQEQEQPSHHDDWEKVFSDNFFPVLVPTIAFCRLMARSGRTGSIVQMSSVSAGGVAGQSPYAAAKSAVEVGSRSLALEFGPLGIRLNSIRVGYMDSPALFANLDQEMVRAKLARISLRRLGDPESLNELIWSIALNSYLSGATISLDGGFE